MILRIVSVDPNLRSQHAHVRLRSARGAPHSSKIGPTESELFQSLGKFLARLMESIATVNEEPMNF